MTKLNAERTNVLDFFTKNEFLIPDYQRPYAWTDNECKKLWEDLFAFSLPDEDYSKFDSKEEYFLGPIVFFKNGNKLEIIDGQQRLTTITLLLRAFYETIKDMRDEGSRATKKRLEECIWKTNEFGNNPIFDFVKIETESVTDRDKSELLNILKLNNPNNKKSNYAKNYSLYISCIDEFKRKLPTAFPYLPNRILKNCILLPIEAENQDTALQIFSTLNDRGLPLSDSDIFKAKLYKINKSENQKEAFISDWKELEEKSENIFKTKSNSAMDELFTLNMYYERAKQGIKNSTTEALRKFYEKKDYEILKKNDIVKNLISLAHFWQNVMNQDKEIFSDDVLKRLFVLNYAPNSIWKYFVSVYFMKLKDEDEKLDNNKFFEFLNKITAFILAYTISNPGVNSLRTPIYAEMVNIINDKDVVFKDYKFDYSVLEAKIRNFSFNNNKPITKSMLVWYAFNNPKQSLLDLEKSYSIEHIYAKKRFEKENSLTEPKNIELLGNKSILESKINIRASDYRFIDKHSYYKGTAKKEGTKVKDLLGLCNQNDFTEQDILTRNEKIINEFIEYVKSILN